MRRRQMFPNVASLQRLPSESGADKSTQPRARQKRSFQRQSKLSIGSEDCPDRNYFRNLDTADGLSKTFRGKREQYLRPQADQVIETQAIERQPAARPGGRKQLA